MPKYCKDCHYVYGLDSIAPTAPFCSNPQFAKVHNITGISIRAVCIYVRNDTCFVEKKPFTPRIRRSRIPKEG